MAGACGGVGPSASPSGASGGLLATSAGDPGAKACSQLPGIQQASQVPAAHTALEGRGRPVSAAPRNGRWGVSSDNPLAPRGTEPQAHCGKGSESPLPGRLRRRTLPVCVCVCVSVCVCVWGPVDATGLSQPLKAGVRGFPAQSEIQSPSHAPQDSILAVHWGQLGSF